VHFLVYHAELELEESTEQKLEIQAEQVQKEYDDPQAPSGMDTNLAIRSRQAPVHQAIIFELCLPLYLNYDSCLCIKSIGVVWHRSHIKIDLPIYPY
jgi:hypothetical protein